MKIVKWVFRILLISPFILGLPIGYKVWDNADILLEAKGFEVVIAVCGTFAFMVVLLALALIVFAFVMAFIEWVFSADKELNSPL